jgi:hypothetical protein
MRIAFCLLRSGYEMVMYLSLYFSLQWMERCYVVVVWSNGITIRQPASIIHFWVQKLQKAECSKLSTKINVILWRCGSTRARASSVLRFLDHLQRRTTVGRTPWTSDQLVAETSTWQHKTLTADKHPYRRRDSNPHFQQASGRRATP